MLVVSNVSTMILTVLFARNSAPQSAGDLMRETIGGLDQDDHKGCGSLRPKVELTRAAYAAVPAGSISMPSCSSRDHTNCSSQHHELLDPLPPRQRSSGLSTLQAGRSCNSQRRG
jgi:hypothetical protein